MSQSLLIFTAPSRCVAKRPWLRCGCAECTYPYAAPILAVAGAVQALRDQHLLRQTRRNSSCSGHFSQAGSWALAFDATCASGRHCAQGPEFLNKSSHGLVQVFIASGQWARFNSAPAMLRYIATDQRYRETSWGLTRKAFGRSAAVLRSTALSYGHGRILMPLPWGAPRMAPPAPQQQTVTASDSCSSSS